MTNALASDAGELALTIVLLIGEEEEDREKSTLAPFQGRML
jgi:hypothetical protein